MDMHRCLADVARLELETLIQDTKVALYGLERQRESVIQAIEAAQNIDECSSKFTDETDLFVRGLIDRANRLNGVLNKITREIEQMEAGPFSPETGQLISWPIWLDMVPAENCWADRGREREQPIFSP
ncbi:MAG: hypothetical protein Kow0063_18560 [Anaerolineae bacterium]